MKIELGTWLSIGNPVIAELAALAGFDWVLLDLEHGCAGESALPDQLRALRGSRTVGIVRVGSLQPDLIAKVLDWGADGIMLPRVASADEAARLVAATRYAPEGSRGYSRTVRAHDYGFEFSQKLPLVLAQIETPEGVEAADSIASVSGVDVLFVGPADLQHALKTRPQGTVPGYDACLRRVVAAAASKGKKAGILTRDSSAIPELCESGFEWIAAGSDLGVLRNAYQDLVQQHR